MFDFLSQKFSGVLGWLEGKTRLTEKSVEEALEQIETALLEADVPFDVVASFLDAVKKEIVGKKITNKLNPGEYLIKIVYEKLLQFLGAQEADKTLNLQIPSIIMVLGLQGSGKTTTLAKLAHWAKKQAEKRGKKRRILLASVDFYRPAAVEQLQILAEKIGVTFYTAEQSDPVAAAREIYDYFKKNNFEHLFLDTAGRLHIDETLMQELKSIDSYLKPHIKLLVLDAMTGQESLKVAQTFNEHVGFHSAILSKMDSDARGGAAFAFRYTVKKPIHFVGSGEKIVDLETFIPERMASRILGMGDLETLLEKADDLIDESSQEEMAGRLLSGAFTLQDFADQMEMMGKLGSLSKIARYLPGSQSLTPEMLEQGQQDMKNFKAIISSMTMKERTQPTILNGSRRKRISRGSGTSVEMVNQLIQRFEQSKQFAKMMKKSSKSGRFW